MKKQVLTAVALSSILLASGCATIINDETQRINIQSTSGVKFSGNIDGTPFQGPGIVEVQRANMNRTINVETEGCAEQTVLNKKVDPVFFINIITGGVFGSTTDYASEEMWKYDDSVTVNCQ